MADQTTSYAGTSGNDPHPRPKPGHQGKGHT
jgi:hypothetical protein